MKRYLAIIITVLMIAALVAGCSCSGDGDKNSVARSAGETTTVIETTPDGGTVEKDADGNKLTKDKDGGIISIEDKNGNAVDVDEYVATHKDAVKSKNASGSAGKDTKSSKSSKSTKSSKVSSSSTSSKSKSSKSSGKKSSGTSNAVEEEIPTVTINDEGLETAPELPDY